MNWTNETIKEFVEGVIKIEQERLKKHGQKLTPDYLTDVLANTIRAMMADARTREIARALKALDDGQDIREHLKERKHATTVMATALQNYADAKQKERK